MTRIWACGFELGTVAAEINDVITGSGVTFDTASPRTGTYCLKLASVSGTVGHGPFVGGGTIASAGVAIKVTARPATTARAIVGGQAAGFCNLRLNPDGTIAYYNGSTLVGTSSVALTDTTRWYWVEYRAGTGSSQVLLRIDSADQITATTTTTISGTIGCVDTVADTHTVFYDDIVADDAAWPLGTCKVPMLKPTSLNAAGGWVEGDGAGTAGMAAAVATTPPPGLASANETAATNIESPTNSATDNCDMNVTTYTAAGVGASDTINAVRAIVRHGEDIATGTKAGAVTIVSNPAQAGETTFNYGNDAGAHGAEPGLWLTTFGAIQSSPSVTLGTAPVLRVGKRTATTRVVCVDFMGIYVDYTPAAVTTAPPVSRIPRRRSLIRTSL